MLWYKYSIIVLLFIWLVILACQSFNILKFGTLTIPKSWVVYVFLGVAGVTALDYFGLLNKNFSNFVFTFLLVHTVAFNLVYAFNLYEVSTLYNRAEHFFGTILAASVALSFLSTKPFFTQISSPEAKLILFFCLVITLGVFNEIFELFMDLFLKTKNVGPEILDTNLDLLTNFIGTTVFVVASKLLRLL